VTDETTPDNCDIRNLLRECQALLTHFATVMGEQTNPLFPNDLLNAISLRDATLSFSTIQIGDKNRHANGHGAEGSVGLVVDIGKNTVIESVYHDDSGSGPRGSFGLRPTVENAAASIDRRQTSNEWRIKNYSPVGILILLPVFVRKAFDLDSVQAEFNAEAVRDGSQIVQETEIGLKEAMSHFGDQRIFGVNGHTFLEFDRDSCRWRPVQYDEIIPPCD
jgi:hypothetical protein